MSMWKAEAAARDVGAGAGRAAGRCTADVRTRHAGGRMTFPRALRSELRRFARTPLAVVHAACAVAAGLACGAYFAVAAWDPALGADAFAQFLGAMMPLMAGIVCGLAVDEERRAGRMANLLAVPARRIAVLAKLAALWLAGLAALAVAAGLFAAVLAAAGRLEVGVGALALSACGIAAGSIPLYALSLALALRFGRNAAIGVGAVGLLLGFFAVGGFAHGLMTGELTGAASMGLLGAVPFAWPARLGSLAVEAALAVLWAQPDALAQVESAARFVGAACAAASVLAVAALAWWFDRFEEGRNDA